MDMICLADKPQWVKVSQDRWNVRIDYVTADGHYRTLIASADAALTDRSGIFLGTEEEYKEKLES